MNDQTSPTPFGISFRRLLLIAALLWCASGTGYAQFSIRKPAENMRQRPEMLESAPQGSLKNVYYDPAAVRARKLRLRKERNTVEFDFSLEGSTQQFINWQSSGDNTIYSLASLFFRHQYKRDKLSSDTRVEATYGMNYTNNSLFKNKDEFKISWQLGWGLKGNWSYSASVNIRSQFSIGYESEEDHTLVSDFLSPGYFDVGGGFTYAPASFPLKITLSPISCNIVTVINETLSAQGKYGVSPGQKVLGHPGYSADVFFDKAFGKSGWFRYRTSLYTFVPYIAPKNITVRWENTVEFRISKYFSTKLYGQLYYRPEDFRPNTPELQYQYALMIGLKYTFRNK